VVVLGAGYDTRPWRLALPPGVKWFEVDLPEVAAAKRQQLAALGAGLGGSKSSGDGAASGAVAHPLKAASWTSLAVDLGEPGCAAALIEKGLDPGQPTAWVVEGLLMYLTEQQTDALLKEIAGVFCVWVWGVCGGLCG